MCPKTGLWKTPPSQNKGKQQDALQNQNQIQNPASLHRICRQNQPSFEELEKSGLGLMLTARKTEAGMSGVSLSQIVPFAMHVKRDLR